MVSFRHILCPVDFSEFSRHAFDHALTIAQWYGGTVTALHVAPVVPLADAALSPVVALPPVDLDQTVRELREFVKTEAGTTPIETIVIQGSTVRTIMEKAEALPADLIVLGTHGRTGFERLMLGSVTESVLRRATCPVLTVPPRAPDAMPLGPVIFRSILCATDFSLASEAAIAYAASLAREAQAALTIMHVVEHAPLYEPVVAGSVMESMRETSLVRVRELAPHGFKASHVVAEGKPYREILRRAADDHSDLIVIGVHSGLADRFHVGSTTNHIVRGAACPVLSLRG